MEPTQLESSFAKLAAMRGDPQKGLPVSAWSEALAGVPHRDVLRAAIDATRELVVTDWSDRRKDDRRPQKALEAVEAWLAKPGDEIIAELKSAAKACTAARNETFGDQHRIPQAARSVAWAATSPKDEAEVFEAFATIEEELLARIALTGEYHRGPEQRRAILDVLRRVLIPKKEEEKPAVSAASLAPVPYNAEGHFELAQRLVHKKFGDVVVTSVGETWIEVELPDASKKRLAHKP